MCLADLAGKVSDLDVTGLDDPGADATKVERLAATRVDEHHRVHAEASGELLATRMWGFRDLDDRIAQRDLRSRWQVFAAKFHIEE